MDFCNFLLEKGKHALLIIIGIENDLGQFLIIDMSLMSFCNNITVNIYLFYWLDRFFLHNIFDNLVSNILLPSMVKKKCSNYKASLNKSSEWHMLIPFVAVLGKY